jgi:Holliday junction DNA helicase RuvA
MIGRLVGRLIRKQPPALVIDVEGVGYELEAPMTAFYSLPDLEQEVIVHTHLVIRDDAHLLFGFTDIEQRDLFRLLLKVSGVGPRVGLAILSGLTTEDLVSCISIGNVDQLTRIPGVGRKTAERLIIDLRDKLEAFENEVSSLPSKVPTPEQDAVSVLLKFGYKRNEAIRAVRESNEKSGSTDELIKDALYNLTKGG